MSNQAKKNVPVENPNENCLQGMACPKCGSFGSFAIEVKMTVTMHDNGSDDEGGDQEWGNESYCRCNACQHTGVVADFREGSLTKEDLLNLGYEINPDPDTQGYFYWISPDEEGSESYYDEGDAIRAASAHAKEHYELSRCDNCGKVHSEETVVEAKDLSMRTEPGGTIPSGECADCGALCFPI